MAAPFSLKHTICFRPFRFTTLVRKMARSSSFSERGNPFLCLLTLLAFTFLDLLDALFCVLYSYIDHLLEGSDASPCYCHRKNEKAAPTDDIAHGNGSEAVDREGELSDTLFGRKNVFREKGFLGKMGRGRSLDIESKQEKRLVGGGGGIVIRWSDCRCGSCVSWIKAGGDLRLHFVLREPSGAGVDDSKGNVVFLHGFLSSSSLWTETVFPNLSESANQNFRLFAVDLLGFARSPKPRDCLYTLKDHLEMIEKSVISPFGLASFHLVAHSMGCIIAVALATKYPLSVKSLTLVAPPYFPLSKDSSSSLTVLEKLAAKRLWPPLLFGASFMSWYEHLGRIVCFLICRSHRVWESILKLVTGRRELDFVITDLARHTHHSAWHTMHNVICGGARLMDEYLETLTKFGVKVVVIQGDQDQVVPLDCSYNLKRKVPEADVRIVSGEDHSSVLIARAKEFAREVESVWTSTDGSF